jgi:LacI family transcriptional regulator
VARRPTITDLAREAGVSVATVDRVLNGRHRVREETARRVYEAAHKIGYHAAGVIKQRILADLPECRLGFVLQKEKQAFYQAFAAELEQAVRAAPNLRGRATIEFASSQAPGDVAELLERLGGRVQAIAGTAVDHHAVTAAVSALRARGVPTFSLLSDYAQGVRESYVGTNNLKVGRTAAWFVLKAAPRPGKVAIFVGGHRWHGHELRETGFRSFLREYAPQFAVLDTLVNLETRQLTYEATLDLLSRHRDLVGFYVAGGGMEGAIAAVRESRAPEELAVVVNEVTPESRVGLLDRYVTAVLATPLTRLCADLVNLMVGAIRHGMAETPGQHFLPSEIHIPESVGS